MYSLFLYQNEGKTEYNFIENVDTETGGVDYKKADKVDFIFFAE